MRSFSVLTLAALLLASCGGGDSGTGGGGVGSPAPTPTPTPSPSATGGSVFAVPAQESLSILDVQRIIAQAAGEAQARNLPSEIAVVDRVGNVLAVFRMNGARATTRTSLRTATGISNTPAVDAQGLDVPASMGAIAKAITGAYLSSSGNAFSTRTASQIVQEHFPPAPTTAGLESGPLFGVQFSQLPCSDLAARFVAGGGAAALIGPKRSPLGLSADPGGLPLYKNGVVVGGIGVVGDGDYGYDPDTLNIDVDAEEAIALAGIQGFAPPVEVLADRITADGTTLRFSDMRVNDLAALQGNFAAINGVTGNLVAVTGYSAGAILAGAAYGSEASGIRASTAAEFANRDAFVLTDGAGANRYPIRPGTDGADNPQPLAAAEVRAVLEEAFTIMSRARAQIRRPLDSRAQVTISVVDTHGEALGIVRSPDAPVFGTDVSLQKARTAAFFSNASAAADLQAVGNLAPFVAATRSFLGDNAALTGLIAYSDRAHGNLSRPYFPDGELGRPPGPFSRPIEDFNPFATGLQVQMIAGNLIAHAQFVAGTSLVDTPQRCTSLPDAAAGQNRLENGIQIFPGSVPIYRGNRLVGAIGVSGDGIDQDDMISFLGTHNGGAKSGNAIGNAPKAIRADNLLVTVGSRQVRLRYIGCPFAPFLDTAQQNVCEGL